MKMLFITAALGYIMLTGCQQEQKSNAYCFYGHFNKQITRDSLGNISRLEFPPNKDSTGEVLEFYSNGNLSSKGLVASSKLNGPTYVYYPSGFTEGYRFFKNGKKVGYATDYYDSSDDVKAYLFYTDEGLLLWRKTYSREGKVIKIEGTIPQRPR